MQLQSYGEGDDIANSEGFIASIDLYERLEGKEVIQ